jgi:hypothetical protein
MAKCYVAVVIDLNNTSVKYYVFPSIAKCDEFIRTIEKRKDKTNNIGSLSGLRTPRYSAIRYAAEMME